MVNFLHYLENPQINYEKFYEVMRDFRKGGLNPTMYDEFIETIKRLPKIRMRGPFAYNVFDKFNLTDVSPDDFMVIQKEVIKRGIRASKVCWHPEASSSNCKVDEKGEIIVSAAHSIQNNGILREISENYFVMGYAFKKGTIEGEEIQKNTASIFWGFCNTHDSIFNPIETAPYTKTEEQNFLFAYRGFVVACHKKMEVSSFMNYGEQSKKDIEENKKLFDVAIKTTNHAVIESEVFELSNFYPIAASSAFYLDFDFEGNEIPHSDDRIENIFVTLLPILKENKTYFILSYFQKDKHLYGNLGEQLRKRNNLKSDITMLLGAHTENVFFNPVYYKTFIEKIEEILHELMFETQMDHGVVGANDEIQHQYSYTTNNYLKNPHNISFFGY